MVNGVTRWSSFFVVEFFIVAVIDVHWRRDILEQKMMKKRKLQVGFFLDCCEIIYFLEFLRERRTMRFETQFVDIYSVVY